MVTFSRQSIHFKWHFQHRQIKFLLCFLYMWMTDNFDNLGFLVQVQVQVYILATLIMSPNLGLLLASVQVPQEILTNLCDSDLS